MLNVEKHRQVLFNILRDIYKSSISYNLGFKGGTMLYFFYGLDRFSVDLDFDLLEEEKSGEIYSEIKDILQKYGTIKDEMDKNFTMYFLLDYGKNEKNIKIEISKRSSKTEEYQWKNFYGTDVLTMKIEDMFANKLVASTQRGGVANRDFYDIFFLLKEGFSFNREIIQKKAGKEATLYLEDLMNFLKKYKPFRGMTDGLGELLTKEKKLWVKQNLKEELVGQLQFLVDEMEKRGK
jgi:predicted nucleotidyltransferase component of viral defense system